MADGSGEGFAVFFADAEPRLRRALIATYGAERGREAAAEALAYAWQHWERVRDMDNSVGYLYRVGQSRSRPSRAPEAFPSLPPADGLWVDPDLPRALADLTERERLAVSCSSRGSGGSFAKSPSWPRCRSRQFSPI